MADTKGQEVRLEPEDYELVFSPVEQGQTIADRRLVMVTLTESGRRKAAKFAPDKFAGVSFGFTVRKAEA